VGPRVHEAVTGDHPLRERSGAMFEALAHVRELLASPDTYCREMACDGLGREIDLRNKNARRWNLSGAIARAIVDLYDGDTARLRNTIGRGYGFQRDSARAKLSRTERDAREMYGLLWGVCEHASTSVVGRSMSSYNALSYDEAMRVLDRALEVVTALVEERVPGEPASEHERELLARVDAAAPAGYRLPDGNHALIVASEALCKRGALRETLAWVFVRR